MDQNPLPGARAGEQGIALILSLIFAILLYVLVAELVVSGRMVRLTGENDALLARMSNQMDYTLSKVEEMLLDDLAAAAAGEEGGAGGLGGLGGAGAGGFPGTGAGAGGEGGTGEEEQDPAAMADSSRDAWYEPTAYADGDLTTYVWVEDENRKFNILSLWSPDQEFAAFSRDRFLRLLDVLREDTEYDLSWSDAERIATELDDWVHSRTRTDAVPRPPLKTDDEEQPEFTIPLHLDELMMLPAVDEDLFFDKVIDGRVILGLESVLTIYTSLGFDPGTPEQQERERRRQQQEGQSGQAPAVAGENPGSVAPAAPSTPGAPQDPNAPPPQPEGIGIRININTASRPVLRALFPQDQVPDLVIDAILRYRNEEDEQQEAQGGLQDYFGDLQLGDEVPRKVFVEVSDLEQIPEFANLPDPQLKADFMRDITTRSDVFSVHMAAMYRRNDENRVFVLRRARSILVRRDDGEDGSLYPLILHEERHGLRVMPVDFPEEVEDLGLVYSEMDYFAQEERAWNPFLRDFYLPPEQREQFYYPR